MKIDSKIEKRCAACGKIISFVLNSAGDWVYKNNKRYFCSYSCMRADKVKKKPCRTRTKELPVIFKADKIAKILDGGITHTQRTMLHQPEDDEINGLIPPYIQGDMLYVRETFRHYVKRVGRGTDCHNESYIAYKADMLRSDVIKDYAWYGDNKWTSAVHMEKKDARLWLKVISCRAVKLQDMKSKDFKAAGAVDMQDFICQWNADVQSTRVHDVSWESNPWVWDIEFEVVDRGKECGCY